MRWHAQIASHQRGPRQEQEGNPVLPACQLKSLTKWHRKKSCWCLSTDGFNIRLNIVCDRTRMHLGGCKPSELRIPAGWNEIKRRQRKGLLASLVAFSSLKIALFWVRASLIYFFFHSRMREVFYETSTAAVRVNIYTCEKMQRELSRTARLLVGERVWLVRLNTWIKSPRGHQCNVIAFTSCPQGQHEIRRGSRCRGAARAHFRFLVPSSKTWRALSW